MTDETYLGDGLYASFDGYQIWLRAPTRKAITASPWRHPSSLTLFRLLIVVAAFTPRLFAKSQV